MRYDDETMSRPGWGERGGQDRRSDEMTGGARDPQHPFTRGRFGRGRGGASDPHGAEGQDRRHRADDPREGAGDDRRWRMDDGPWGRRGGFPGHGDHHGRGFGRHPFPFARAGGRRGGPWDRPEHGPGRHGGPGPFGRFGGGPGPFGDGPGPFGRGGRPDRFFARGELRYVILDLVSEQPRHGYDIIRALEEQFSGLYSPSPGTVYPTLNLLEDQGFVASEQEDGKKVYRATDAGRAELAEKGDMLRAIRDRIGARPEFEVIHDARDLVHDIRDLAGTVMRAARRGDLADADRVARLREAIRRTRAEINGIIDAPAAKGDAVTPAPDTTPGETADGTPVNAASGEPAGETSAS